MPNNKTNISLHVYFEDRNILIVDDIRLFRKSIKDILTECGVKYKNILEASDGNLALEIIRNNPKKNSLILLDWNMPNLSGIKTLKIMREDANLSHIPVLMITSENNENKIIEAIENKAEGYLVKPFSPKTLEEKIINILNPPKYVNLINKGENYLKQGEHQKALTIFQELLKTNPDSAGVRILMGRVYEELKDDDKACQFYTEATKINYLFLRAHKTLAKFHIKRGNKKAALKSLETAAEISPSNANRHLMIGKIILEIDNDPVKAEEAFQAAIKQAPEAASEIAEVYLAKGDPPQAEKFFRAALDQDANVQTYNRLGIALRKQGKWNKSIEEYQNALKVEPKDEIIFFNMGMAYIEGHKKQDAVQCFKKALEIKPDFNEATNALKKIQT